MSLLKDILHNKYVLYLVFAVAIIDLLYASVKLDYLYCVIFVLIGFITSFFSKNMTVILTLTIALATIVRAVIKNNQLRVEGMETDIKQDDKGKDKNKEEEENAKDENSGDASKETTEENSKEDKKTKLVNDMKTDAVELVGVQNKIISGFKTIEPHMDRAESLIGSIQKTAKTIQQMRASDTEKTFTST